MLISDIPQRESGIPYNVPLLPIWLKRFDLYRNREGRPVRHWHEDTQLMMVDTGSAHLSVENTDFLLQEGDFLMIASRKGHAVLPGGSRCCIVTGIMVDLSTMLGNHSLPDKIYGALFLEMNRDYLHIPAKDPANSRIRKIMSRIFEIEDDKPRSGSLEILGLLYQMLAVLLAYHEKTLSHDNEKTTEEDSINRMLSYIARWYMNDIRLENIARAGQVCRSRCCALFRSYLGLSPIRFLNTYRLSISKDLLLSTDRKIVDIATQCGFQNESYFIRLFSKQYGSTPRIYRQQSNRDSADNQTEYRGQAPGHR